MVGFLKSSKSGEVRGGEKKFSEPYYNTVNGNFFEDDKEIRRF